MIYLIIIIIAIIVIFIIVSRVIIFKSKKSLSNSLLLFWDIYCKLNVVDFLNNNNIQYKLTEILDIGILLQINSNYICLMSKHPQEYNNIHILFNEIETVVKNNKIMSIVGFSTAGSYIYTIGQVIQFDSAIIQDPQKYSINYNYIKTNKLLYKTTKFNSEPITNTKGFVLPTSKQYASGEDEFVTYLIGNKMNLPTLTMTGISDNNDKSEYTGGGGNLAAKNIVDYFFDTIII